MTVEKRIHKYGTGDAIPDGAVFLSTVTQTSILSDDYPYGTWGPCWLVWHYLLVEVEAPS